MIGVDDDLRVAGGRGQGVLVVRGSVVFGAGAYFRGLVLAGGDLTLEDGAVLEGGVRVGGNVTAMAGTSIRGSACAIGLALEGTAGLRRPLPLEEGRTRILP